MTESELALTEQKVNDGNMLIAKLKQELTIKVSEHQEEIRRDHEVRDLKVPSRMLGFSFSHQKYVPVLIFCCPNKNIHVLRIKTFCKLKKRLPLANKITCKDTYCHSVPHVDKKKNQKAKEVIIKCRILVLSPG